MCDCCWIDWGWKGHNVIEIRHHLLCSILLWQSELSSYICMYFRLHLEYLILWQILYISNQCRIFVLLMSHSDAQSTSREPTNNLSLTHDVNNDVTNNVTNGTSRSPQQTGRYTRQHVTAGPEGPRRATKRLLPSPPQSPTTLAQPPCFQGNSSTVSHAHISSHGEKNNIPHDARPHLQTQTSRCELLTRSSLPRSQTQSPPRRHPHISNSYTKYFRHWTSFLLLVLLLLWFNGVAERPL